MSTSTETEVVTVSAHDHTIPCEQAEDDGCPNPATHRAAHIACGWGLLFCEPCIQIWMQQLEEYPFDEVEPICKACRARVMGPDEMEPRPL